MGTGASTYENSAFDFNSVNIKKFEAGNFPGYNTMTLKT